MNKNRAFYNNATLLGVLILLLLLSVEFLYPALNISANAYIGILIIGVLTMLTYYILSKSAGRGSFMYAIILSMIVKLVLFGIYNFLVIYFDREKAVSTVIVFFITYFLFTGLEVAFLLLRLNNQQDKTGG